ncbi:MAG: hypothetical protein CL521_03590 [Actinobacteria bacterium]|nr:hypothetical protein [Actinomycetota bacterium]
MTRNRIILLGLVHASIMLATTIWASLEMNILKTGPLFDEAWFIATLVDTYLGFGIVYLWLALTWHHTLIRILYFIGFICLGNIAIGIAIAHRAYSLGPKLTVAMLLKGDLK